MTARPLDFRISDGTRLFASIPAILSWYEAWDRLIGLPGTEVIGFLIDGATEAWIDFRFRDRSFSVNEQFGEYWFFVVDPDCPDAILVEIIDHFVGMTPGRSVIDSPPSGGCDR